MNCNHWSLPWASRKCHGFRECSEEEKEREHIIWECYMAGIQMAVLRSSVTAPSHREADDSHVSRALPCRECIRAPDVHDVYPERSPRIRGLYIVP